jgi:hypothetical protein
MNSKLCEAIRALDAGDWNLAHRTVQALEGPVAAWLHGILHMIEGDESNARYWYQRAGRDYPGKAQAESELQSLKAG